MTKSSGSLKPIKSFTLSPRIPPERGNKTSRLVIKDAIISVFLAAGLASMFIAPIHRFSTPVTTGQIAGARDSQPLTVFVTVAQPNQTNQLEIQPKSGQLVETLARVADELHGSFAYTSRGAGQYLETFMYPSGTATGQWTILHNGLPVRDLSQGSLNQFDEVTITWKESI